jgi:hypothetical protein
VRLNPPPPPQGYFGRKILVFNNLPGVSVCKIFITNGLLTKSLKSISYPWRGVTIPAGLACFFDLYIHYSVLRGLKFPLYFLLFE